MATRPPDDHLFIDHAASELHGERTARGYATADLLEAAAELPEGHPVRVAAVRCARAILDVDEAGNRLNTPRPVVYVLPTMEPN